MNLTNHFVHSKLALFLYMSSRQFYYMRNEAASTVDMNNSIRRFHLGTQFHHRIHLYEVFLIE